MPNTKKINPGLFLKAKKFGFSDKQLAHILNTTEEKIRNYRDKNKIYPVYKTVDTCAAEFEAFTPETMAQQLAYNSIVESKKELNYLKKHLFLLNTSSLISSLCRFARHHLI